MLYIKLIEYISMFLIFMKMNLFSEKIVFSVLTVLSLLFAVCGMFFHSILAAAAALFFAFCLLCAYDVHTGRKLARGGVVEDAVQSDMLLMMFR